MIVKVRIDATRVGDVVITTDECAHPYRVIRAHGTAPDCRIVRSLFYGAETMFAGCVEMYGPFRGVGDVGRAIGELVAPMERRLARASVAIRTLRPAALDWATPDELALHTALCIASSRLDTIDDARARVAAKRAARRAGG